MNLVLFAASAPKAVVEAVKQTLHITLYEKVSGQTTLRDVHTTLDDILYFQYFITALKKGQALSGYYRVLLKDGGWIWMQTKANVVYQTSTGQPQFISCIHYVIRYITFIIIYFHLE